MKKYKNLLLRLLPLLLVATLTVGLSELFYRNMVVSATQSCWDELSMAHSEASREISIRMNNNLKMLHLAADAIVPHAAQKEAQSVLKYLDDVRLETIFDRIDVIFPDGTVLVQSTGERIAVYSEKAYQQLLSRGIHFSQRVPDFLTGDPAVQAFSPVYDENGDPAAILGATIYCSTMTDTFASVHYGEDARLFLVDQRDGNLVLDNWHEQPDSIYSMRTYTLPEKYKGTDFITEIMAGNSGQLAYDSAAYETTSYTIYAPVEGTDFSLIMSVQEDVLFASVHDLQATLTWVGLAEIILFLFFSFWIYRILYKSMQNENRAQQAELALLQQKEQELESQFAAAANRQEFLERMAANLPGGYHRCTTDHRFRLTFVSSSFTQITGYTLEQAEAELGGSYMGIVCPEDRDYFMSLAPQLERDGAIHCAYRIRRRDGQLRWVQDSTQRLESYGEQYYQCALMDISDRIEEIERAKQAAEASSQAKSTFLFNISHDIRTPMNAIKGFSHIIEENADNPQVVLDSIGKLNQAGESLMMLMNDVLDISRIERGKEELDLQPMNLCEHGKNLYEMFAADMQEAGIRFLVGGEELDDYIYCDHLKLTRVMMNMLSNAKKFTPAGGTVIFGGTRLHKGDTACTYRLYVQDTGIGMGKEFLNRAFEQFERERTSTESGVSGSGLGLAIIKMLVELMGGTVEIRSDPGKGTEIAAILTFQLADPEQHQETAMQASDTLDIRGKRILVVEDNDFNREIARYVLEGLQLVVDEAENGALCLEKLAAAQPGAYDLILMDIQMPVMDGYTATKEIRQLEDQQIAAIPIVAMTANAFEEDKRKCLEVGMNGHIGKPIDIQDLMRVLTQVL